VSFKKHDVSVEKFLVYNFEMLNKILSAIENKKISISEWITAFVGILFVRFFLEFFSNPSPYGGSITSDGATLVHYFLFFFSALFGVMVIVRYFSDKKSGHLNLFLFSLPIIWLSPVVDIVASHGKGFLMTYLFDNGRNLILDFLTFFGPHFAQGATIGIRIEIVIILFGIGFYIWQSRKKILPVILAVLISYSFIFFLYSLPGTIYTINHIQNFNSSNQITTLNFLEKSIVGSNIGQNIQDNGMTTYGSYQIFLEFGTDKLFSQIFFLLSVFFLAFWFYKTQKEKFLAILKNSRPERVLFYFTLLLLGMLSAFIFGLGSFKSWVDIMSLTILLISWYGGWMFAVHTNDIADIGIDAVSNPDRPITGGKLLPEEMKQTAVIWLSISLIGAFIVGYYPFFMNLVFLAVYYIYSMPPLRLKRVPMLSSFLISIAVLSTVLCGFFWLSADKNFRLFPMLSALGIILIFTFGVNVRDMKDVDGDRAEGVMTLPVIFKENGAKVVGLLLSASFLFVPIIFSFYTLYIFAIPAAIVGYKMVTRKLYKEKYIFILYFSFLLATVLLIGALYLFAMSQNLLFSF
jgi:4-hydroxybenzoate polyprenyltransferase